MPGSVHYNEKEKKNTFWLIYSLGIIVTQVLLLKRMITMNLDGVSTTMCFIHSIDIA